MTLDEVAEFLSAWCRLSIIVISVFEGPVDGRFAGLHDFSSDDHLVKDLINFVKVENEVELTHAAKVLVEHLHK